MLDPGTDTFPTYVEAASADGSNVYITTHAQLVPQDIDGLRDLYDVRVEGGIPVPAGPSECSGEGCQGSAGGGLSTSRRASETAAAGGNVAPGNGGGAGTGVGGGGVKGFTKRVVKGTSVALTIMAPSAGKITASGSGLKSKSMAVTKAGTYKLKIVLTAEGDQAAQATPQAQEGRDPEGQDGLRAGDRPRLGRQLHGDVQVAERHVGALPGEV